MSSPDTCDRPAEAVVDAGDGVPPVPPVEAVRPVPPVPPVEAVLAAVRGLAGTDWGSVDRHQLVSTLVGVETVRSVLDAVTVELVRRMEVTRAGEVEGWASTAQLVTAVSGGGKGSGPGLVRLARRLADLPATRAAMAAGGLSRAKASVVAARVSSLPFDPPRTRPPRPRLGPTPTTPPAPRRLTPLVLVGQAALTATTLPSGRSAAPSSKKMTPLHSRHHPCS
jgi:hypothetical protein